MTVLVRNVAIFATSNDVAVVFVVAAVAAVVVVVAAVVVVVAVVAVTIFARKSEKLPLC